MTGGITPAGPGSTVKCVQCKTADLSVQSSCVICVVWNETRGCWLLHSSSTLSIDCTCWCTYWIMLGLSCNIHSTVLRKVFCSFVAVFYSTFTFIECVHWFKKAVGFPLRTTFNNFREELLVPDKICLSVCLSINFKCSLNIIFRFFFFLLHKSLSCHFRVFFYYFNLDFWCSLKYIHDCSKVWGQ